MMDRGMIKLGVRKALKSMAAMEAMTIMSNMKPEMRFIMKLLI